MHGLSQKTRITYRLDLTRAISLGILEAAAGTFLILIAIRVFSAAASAKAWLASGTYGGLLLTPLVVELVRRLRIRVTTAAAVLAAIGAVAYIGILIRPILPALVLLGLTANACAVLPTPLMTQVYHYNYPADVRGRLYSKAVALRIGSAALFSFIAGRLLEHSLDLFHILLASWALAFVVLAVSTFYIPSTPLGNDPLGHPFRALTAIRHDRVVKTTLISWMLMGSANLMMVPLRVEFLGNPEHGLNLSPGRIAMLTAVLPSVFRLLSAPFWGWIFDKVNFFKLRILLNLLFAAATLCFFLSNSLIGLSIGAVLYGLATSGGDVAWGLWITLFTPPQRTAAYMSIHTFLTGVRGFLAPQISFRAVGYLGVPIPLLATVAAVLIVLAGIILIPLIPYGTARCSNKYDRVGPVSAGNNTD